MDSQLYAHHNPLKYMIDYVFEGAVKYKEYSHIFSHMYMCVCKCTNQFCLDTREFLSHFSPLDFTFQFHFYRISCKLCLSLKMISYQVTHTHTCFYIWKFKKEIISCDRK